MKKNYSQLVLGLTAALWIATTLVGKAGQLLSISYSSSTFSSVSLQATNVDYISTNFPTYYTYYYTYYYTNNGAQLSLFQSKIYLHPFSDENPVVTCQATQDLWACNPTDPTSPITITVTPQFSYDYDYHLNAGCTLYTSINDQWSDTRVFDVLGPSVNTNNLSAFSFSVTNGAKITFDLTHFCRLSTMLNTVGRISTANYSVSVSTNGFLTNVVPSLTVATTNLPVLTQIAFTDNSHTQLVVTGINGPTNSSAYYVLCTTNLAVPLADWIICQTNVFTANGGFSFVFPVTKDLTPYYLKIRLAD